MTPPAPTASVLGAGIAGLAAAIALRRAGYDVEVIERAATIEPLGAAISVWANGMEALDRLGAGEAIRREAEPIVALSLMTRRGGRLIGPSAPARDRSGGTGAFLARRSLIQSSLLEALRGRVPIHLGCDVATIAQDVDGATLTLADGRVRRADLLVDARGIWSADAPRITSGKVRHAGYGGVLALSDPVEDDGPAGIAAEYWGERERFGVCDLGGGRRYWFYMRDESPGDGPPNLQNVRERAALFPTPVERAVAATPANRLIPISIHARTRPRRYGEGRIVCVGDAAHAMEPNLGQGACQGLEDALALGHLAEAVGPERIAAGMDRLRLARVGGLMRDAALASRAVHAGAATRAVARTALRLTPAAVHGWAMARQQRLPAAPADVGRPVGTS